MRCLRRLAGALNASAREAPRFQNQAIALDLHPLAPVYYEASNTYLRQVIRWRVDAGRGAFALA